MKHIIIILIIGAIGIGLFYRSADTSAGSQEASTNFEKTDSSKGPAQAPAPENKSSASNETTEPNQTKPLGTTAEDNVDNTRTSESSTEEPADESDTKILANILNRIDGSHKKPAQPRTQLQNDSERAKDQESIDILEGLMRDLNK